MESTAVYTQRKQLYLTRDPVLCGAAIFKKAGRSQEKDVIEEVSFYPLHY